MPMTINVAGPVLIRTGTGASAALEDLGYTIEGVEIQEQPKYLDVYGDQNGGSSGIPIDVQYMGEMHVLRFDLSKWDDAVMAKIAVRLRGGTAGEIGTVGTLWGAASKTYRVLLTATNFTRNYVSCLPLEPVGMNAGSKYSRKSFAMVCYPNSSNVIWNTTTS
jgi:hypothetical protein